MSDDSSFSSGHYQFEQTFQEHQLPSVPPSGYEDTLVSTLNGYGIVMGDGSAEAYPAPIPGNVPPVPLRQQSDSSQVSHHAVEETEQARMDRLFNQQNLLMALEEDEAEAQLKEDEEHGMDEEHLNTLTTMEKENLSSNKRQMGSWLRKWLYGLKSYFLFAHIAYICTVALTSAILIYLLERGNTDIEFVDAIFAACSFVSCTGLVAVDLEKWSPGSYAVRMLTMILGGNCFMSATMPLLRWFTLRRLKEETIVDSEDRYVLKRWKLRKRNFIDRLETTSILCATGTYFYWCAFHILAFVVLACIPKDDMRIGEVLEHVITAFQNCCSLPLNFVADNGVFIFTIAVITAAGNTLFPLFFRIQFHGLLYIMRAYKAFSGWWRRFGHESEGEEEYFLDGGETTFTGRQSNLTSMVRGRQSNVVPNLSRDATWDEGRAQGVSKWELGVLTILQHEDPGVFHPFLFSWSQTRYILYTFILLNAVQMIPFLIQQWDVTLAPFGGGQKFLVAFCQSVYVRFAGVNIVNTVEFSNVHTLWILFAMYIPVIPIPGDRGKRKWKEMARAGAWRLLTSRIFLLFFSMSCIVWIEEGRLLKEIEGTPFDMATRALFEIVSGYSTSGMSLPLGNRAYFTESLTHVSRAIIAVNMIIGRHRWMDLGIDIGLDQLEESDRVIQKYLKEREEDGEDYAPVAPERGRSLLDRFRKKRNSGIWDAVSERDPSTMHFRQAPLSGSVSQGASTFSRASNIRFARRSLLERAVPLASSIPAPGHRFPMIAVGDQLAAPGSSASRTPGSSTVGSRHGSVGAAGAIAKGNSRSVTPRSVQASSLLSHATSHKVASRTTTPRSPGLRPVSKNFVPISTPPKRGAATRAAPATSVLDGRESRVSMSTVRKSNSTSESLKEEPRKS